ncbi:MULTISPECIES: hypothetical protein [unclassified Methylobacterium]|uniref:hypothetical protein n=1 Tax=unclassified Methylobacterium TaxID=2615210 RepID=UPI00138EE2A3|nr:MULTISPECIES: hypothetical protein [unclassified Methylobacterium]
MQLPIDSTEQAHVFAGTGKIGCQSSACTKPAYRSFTHAIRPRLKVVRPEFIVVQASDSTVFNLDIAVRSHRHVDKNANTHYDP